MKILIDRSIFGGENYLLVQGDDCAWVESPQVNHDLFLSSDKSNSLNSFNELYGVDPIIFIEEKYKKSLSEVGAKNPNWKFSLPREVYSGKINSLFSSIKKMISFFSSDQYPEVYARGNHVLQKLSRILPNQEVLDLEIENPTIRKIISSFAPDGSGFAPKLSYDRMKTVTGRLVVESGPQVLLLPRKMKNVFKSRYEDGSIAWIDFVSLEPRFAKLLTSRITEKDIYTDVMNEYELECGREKVKAAVLSTLFGAGLTKLTEIVGREAMVIKKAIDEYFNLGKILEMTGDYKSGSIRNYFGRPITLKKCSSNVAINNFIQSSSVDVSLVGFSNLVNDTRMPDSAKPLCVIHDALVIDIRNDDIPQLSKIINDGIDIKGIGHFFLEYDVL